VTPAAPGPVSAALAQAYARFQNATEDGTIFDEWVLPAKRDKSGHDFYADALIRCLAQARENVQKVEGVGLEKPQAICEVLELVGEHPNELADGFGAVPFAWIHNDFRDENIVGADGDGGGQRLIDWGSSYGYGPYLYDIAPYLLESGEAMRAYAVESTIWRRRTVDQRSSDLIVCATAALLGYLHWHLGDLLQDGDVACLQRSLQRRQVQFQLLRDLLV
jgi:thiamine kinase-like enzyme